jgi:integrase
VSIEKRQRKSGVRYIVWWRDGARVRNKTFTRKADAEAWEAKVKLAKRAGDLDSLDAGRRTLSDFIDEWWRLAAEPRLEKATLEHYQDLRDRYIVPRLGKYQLRRLTPQVLQQFVSDLDAAGVGSATVLKILALLSGILRLAEEWGQIRSNPVRLVRKPRQTRRRAVRPLAPETVEAIRSRLLRQGRHRDAVLISVLAYSGLRPGEALALTWGDIREQTIIVDKALALGETKETKTRKNRTVGLLKPLASDLAEWRMASGRPSDDCLVFPMQDGRPWTESKYRNWRREVYVPTAEAVGLEKPRPYDLRHSCASLLFAETRNPIEIAEHMGNSLPVLLSTYMHVLEELRGQPPRSAEVLIRQAREKTAQIRRAV